MGHCLAVLIFNGNVISLEIFPDGSGLATHTPPLLFSPLSNALVALSGPLLPPIIGYFMSLSTKNLNKIRLALLLISLLIFLSMIFWVRNWFALLFLAIIGILIFYGALTKSNFLSILLAQIISIQAFFSVYLSMGYIFSKTGEINQSSFISDTAIAEQYTGIPYWFWGIIIVLLSLLLFYHSIKLSFRNFKRLLQ